jgi:hypothetical protein
MAQNTFWVAANIMFDIRSGETREILLLANKAEDATVFTKEDADRYYNFVTLRAANLIRNTYIVWSIEPVTTIPHVLNLTPPSQRRYVIKGVQNV